MRDHLYSICSSVCIWMFTTHATIYRFTKFLKTPFYGNFQKLSFFESDIGIRVPDSGIHKLDQNWTISRKLKIELDQNLSVCKSVSSVMHAITFLCWFWFKNKFSINFEWPKNFKISFFGVSFWRLKTWLFFENFGFLWIKSEGVILSKLCQNLVFSKVQCNVCVSLCTFVLFLSKNRVFSLLKKIIVWQQFDCFFEIVC